MLLLATNSVRAHASYYWHPGSLLGRIRPRSRSLSRMPVKAFVHAGAEPHGGRGVKEKTTRRRATERESRGCGVWQRFGAGDVRGGALAHSPRPLLCLFFSWLVFLLTA